MKWMQTPQSQQTPAASELLEKGLSMTAQIHAGRLITQHEKAHLTPALWLCWEIDSNVEISFFFTDAT